MLTAIPLDLRRAIGVGIGLFIAFIGAVNARLVVIPGGTMAALADDPRRRVTPGDRRVTEPPETLIALAGLLLVGILLARRQPGALLIGIVATTGLALATGHVALAGVWRLVRDAALGHRLARPICRPRCTGPHVPLLLSLMMVDFFDTLGTATAVADEAELSTRRANPGRHAVAGVDSLSASHWRAVRRQQATSYIESAAGVAEGARTGLHSVFVRAVLSGGDLRRAAGRHRAGSGHCAGADPRRLPDVHRRSRGSTSPIIDPRSPLS